MAHRAALVVTLTLANPVRAGISPRLAKLLKGNRLFRA
jgi:hypothetical protein